MDKKVTKHVKVNRKRKELFDDDDFDNNNNNNDFEDAKLKNHFQREDVCRPVVFTHPFKQSIDISYDQITFYLPFARFFKPFASTFSDVDLDVKNEANEKRLVTSLASLQFLCKALQSKRFGSKSLGKRSLNFIDESGEPAPKVRVFVEVCPRRVYVDESRHDEKLSLQELLEHDNIVGVRIYFIAVDPEFRFAAAINKQLKLNESYNGDESSYDDDDDDDSDDDDDFVVADDVNGDDGDYIDAAFEAKPASKKAKSETSSSSAAKTAQVKNNTEKATITTRSTTASTTTTTTTAAAAANDDQKSNTIDNETSSNKSALQEQEQERPKKSGSKKQYRDEFNRGLAIRSGKQLKATREVINIRDRPQLLYRLITTKNALAWLVGLQTGEPQTECGLLNHDDLSALSVVNVIRRSQRGLHTVQCEPEKYFQNQTVTTMTMTTTTTKGKKKRTLFDDSDGNNHYDLVVVSDSDDAATAVAAVAADKKKKKKKNNNNDGDEDKKKNKISKIQNAFDFVVPELAFEIHIGELTPDKLLRCELPWFRFTRTYFEQWSLSVIVHCSQHRIGLEQCEQRQAELAEDFVKKERKIDRIATTTVDAATHEIVTIAKRDQAVIQYHADPLTTIAKKMKPIEVAVQDIYLLADDDSNDNDRLYVKYMNMFRAVMLQYAFGDVFNKNNADLSVALVNALQFIDEEKGQVYAEMTRRISDLSLYGNLLVAMMLAFELDDVCVHHEHMITVFECICTANFSRTRTGDSMLRASLMIHGQPGAGKSVFNDKIKSYLMPDTYDTMSSKSALAHVNSRSKNGTVELYDESPPLFDAPQNSLSQTEKAQRRAEQEGMSRGVTRRDVTVTDKTTGARQVVSIVSEVDHPKIVISNAPKKYPGAMSERFTHIFVEKNSRIDKPLSIFVNLARSPEKQLAISRNMQIFRSLQAISILTGSANKFYAVPNPNMSVFQIVRSQFVQFITRKAPSMDITPREYGMNMSLSLGSIMQRAAAIAFLSELSPHRRMLVRHDSCATTTTNGGDDDEQDLLKNKIVYEQYRPEHILEMGPLMVCTEEIALKHITSTFLRNVSAIEYKTVDAVAKIGNFDVRKVFAFVDKTSTEESIRLKQALAQYELEMKQKFMNENFSSEELQQHCVDFFTSRGLADIAFEGKASPFGDDDDNNAQRQTRSLFPQSSSTAIMKHLHRGEEKSVYTNKVVHTEHSDGDKILRLEDVEFWDTSNTPGVAADAVSFNTSFVRIPISIDDLLRNDTLAKKICTQFKLKIDADTFRQILPNAQNRQIKVRQSPQIPMALRKFTALIQYQMACKLDDNWRPTKESTHPVIVVSEGGSKKTDCCYIAIDFLLEQPTRLVEQFVNECGFRHTRPQKVLVGIVEDYNSPFWLKPIELRRNESRPTMEMQNPDYLSGPVRNATINRTYLDNGSHNNKKRKDNNCFSKKEISISKDVEEYAFDQHFHLQGYDMKYVKYYYPKNEEMVYKYLTESETFNENDELFKFAAERHVVMKLRLATGQKRPAEVVVDAMKKEFLVLQRTMAAHRAHKNMKLSLYNDLKNTTTTTTDNSKGNNDSEEKPINNNDDAKDSKEKDNITKDAINSSNNDDDDDESTQKTIKISKKNVAINDSDDVYSKKKKPKLSSKKEIDDDDSSLKKQIIGSSKDIIIDIDDSSGMLIQQSPDTAI